MINPKKVCFKGMILWFREDETHAGALAPLDHCDDEGDILDIDTAWLSDSYAHVYANGEIRRYGRLIGHRDDLVEIKTEA